MQLSKLENDASKNKEVYVLFRPLLDRIVCAAMQYSLRCSVTGQDAQFLYLHSLFFYLLWSNLRFFVYLWFLYGFKIALVLLFSLQRLLKRSSCAIIVTILHLFARMMDGRVLRKSTVVMTTAGKIFSQYSPWKLLILFGGNSILCWRILD